MEVNTEITTVQAKGRELVGLYSAEDLAKLVATQGEREYLIDGLFTDPSFNILVGDSGLGKTALALSMGVAVASGKPWLNRAVSKAGAVIYFNGEMNPGDLEGLVGKLSAFAGLQAKPKNLFIYSPMWQYGIGQVADFNSVLEAIKPRFVIVDPLRVFFPGAEMDTEKFNALLSWARASGVTVLVVHHRRKHNKEHGTVSLADDAHSWLQETVGLGALINLTDTRMGMDKGDYGSGADIVLGGFVRMRGVLQPIHLQRVMDEQGDPQGYAPLAGIEHLRPEFREAYNKLGEEFRWKDASTALGTKSGSRTTQFIDQAIQFGLIKKEGVGGQARYVRVKAN